MISVIVPTLNEAAHLSDTLIFVRANAAPHEIIVVDGGSGDGTPAVAAAADARVIDARTANRAVQMNLGAQHASGTAFLFLHADTRIARTSLAQIENALRDDHIVGGGFARRFDSDSAFLKVTCVLATLRSALFGLFLGDQGIFVRRTVFQQLGGFTQLILFEDLDFSRRLARAGKTIALRPPVMSSARRFAQRGPLWTTCRDLWLTCRYICGWRPIPPVDVCCSPESGAAVAASPHPACASNRAVSRRAK